MRPINQPTSFPNYAVPAHKSTSALYQAMYNIVAPTGGTPTNRQFTLANYATVLRFIQEIVITKTPKKDRFGKNVSIAGALILKRAIETADNALNLDNVYGSARLDMISALGQYCSYCEMPVGDSSLAIEHMLPKSAFLDLAVNTGNFLLACPVCNSKKLSNPVTLITGSLALRTYQWPINWSNPTIASVTTSGTSPVVYPAAPWPNNYDEVKNVLFNAYMWPQYQGAHQGFLYALSREYASIWSQWPNAFNVVLRSISNGFIYAAPPKTPKQKKAPVAQKTGLIISSSPGVTAPIAPTSVPISAPSYPGPPATFTPNGAAMVEKFQFGTGSGMLDLNAVSEGASFSDRRLFNRTKVWFAARDAYNRLQRAKSITLSSVFSASPYKIVMEEVCSTASASGFFSVWVTLFNGYAPAIAGPTGPAAPPGSPLPNATVDFINGVTVAAPVGGGFPGTNIANTVP